MQITSLVLITVALAGPAGLLDVKKLESTTVEHQIILARNARGANAPARAAEAIATAMLLPAQIAPSSVGLVSSELPALQAYLRKTGEELYTRALAADAAGDRRTAVKAYLIAVKCEPSLLARDDHGLGAIGLRALAKLADAHPERPELRFQLGYYSFLFGDTTAAIAALERQQQAATDEYARWRSGVWLGMMKASVAPAATGAHPAPSGTRGPPPPSPGPRPAAR